MPALEDGSVPQDFTDWQAEQQAHPVPVEVQIARNNAALPPSQRVMLDAKGNAVMLTVTNQIKKAFSGKVLGVPKSVLALGVVAVLVFLLMKRKKKGRR